MSFFQLLLLAGTETTTNLIANTMICLLDHPAQLARVQQDLDLLPAAIEEALRFRSPVQMVFRATTEPVELRGKRIDAGQLVLVVVGAANRDPGQFRHASRFDIARERTPHLAFGHGIHFCIGAALARVESRVALSALLRRCTNIRRVGRRAWTPRAGVNVHGPTSFPLRFDSVQ